LKMIGIAGGSGSGKTTFARLLTDALGRENVLTIGQDSYYIDQSHRFDRDGGSVNFDHPESIDWKLLEEHLRWLRQGVTVQMPIYDFATHKRSPTVIEIKPKPFIILDGILIYVQPEIVRHLDLKIFIQTRESVRFERRLKRDVVERGRTDAGVRAQFANQVKPMHDQFVEPSLACADKIISGEVDFTSAIQEIV
jgi:uridine kinase